MAPLSYISAPCNMKANETSSNVFNSRHKSHIATQKPFPHSYSSENRVWNDCGYYDAKLAEKCHKLLRKQSKQNFSCRISLHPEEEWACGSVGIQWQLKVNRWWRRSCTVTEQRAGRTTSVGARIEHNRDGTLTIRGRFKRPQDPDFALHLTAKVGRPDFEKGYVMTGALQLGNLKGDGRLKITHFAAMPRYPLS